MTEEDFFSIQSRVQPHAWDKEGLGADAFTLLCEVRRLHGVLSDIVQAQFGYSQLGSKESAHRALDETHRLCMTNLRFEAKKEGGDDE